MLLHCRHSQMSINPLVDHLPFSSLLLFIRLVFFLTFLTSSFSQPCSTRTQIQNLIICSVDFLFFLLFLVLHLLLLYFLIPLFLLVLFCLACFLLPFLLLLLFLFLFLFFLLLFLFFFSFFFFFLLVLCTTLFLCVDFFTG